MLSYEVKSLISVLEDYKLWADAEIFPRQQHLHDAMEQCVESCAPALRELRMLLHAARYVRKMEQLASEIAALEEQRYRDVLAYEGDHTFVTTQFAVCFPLQSGPDLKANSLEEAQNRAKLLGLQVIGKA